MTYLEFLDRVIDRGIHGAVEDYASNVHRRDGAIAGFEACRGKLPDELMRIYAQAEVDVTAARRLEMSDEDMARFQYRRCFAAEVEWVLNVVSAMFIRQGTKPIVTPTVRGAMQAERILVTRRPN